MSGVDKLINAAQQGNLQQVKFIIENEGIHVNSKNGVMNEFFISLFIILILF